MVTSIIIFHQFHEYKKINFCKKKKEIDLCNQYIKFLEFFKNIF